MGWSEGPVRGTADAMAGRQLEAPLGQSEQLEGRVTAAQSQGQAGSSGTLCLGQWPHVPHVPHCSDPAVHQGLEALSQWPQHPLN